MPPGRRTPERLRPPSRPASSTAAAPGVTGRRRDVGMSEKVGDDFEVHTGRDEGRRERVAKVVDAEPAGDASHALRHREFPGDLLLRERLVVLVEEDELRDDLPPLQGLEHGHILLRGAPVEDIELDRPADDDPNCAIRAVDLQSGVGPPHAPTFRCTWAERSPRIFGSRAAHYKQIT